MKVLLAAMLVNALHAAFENRVIALDGVRADDGIRAAIMAIVLLARVVGNLMRDEVFPR